MAQQKADAEVVSLATIDLNDFMLFTNFSRISPRNFMASSHSINPKLDPVDQGIK